MTLEKSVQGEGKDGSRADLFREIWRSPDQKFRLEVSPDFEAIRIDKGGSVVTLPLAELHALAWNRRPEPPDAAPAEGATCPICRRPLKESIDPCVGLYCPEHGDTYPPPEDEAKPSNPQTCLHGPEANSICTGDHSYQAAPSEGASPEPGADPREAEFDRLLAEYFKSAQALTEAEGSTKRYVEQLSRSEARRLREIAFGPAPQASRESPAGRECWVLFDKNGNPDSASEARPIGSQDLFTHPDFEWVRMSETAAPIAKSLPLLVRPPKDSTGYMPGPEYCSLVPAVESPGAPAADLEAGRLIRDVIRQHRFNVTGREWEDLSEGQKEGWRKVAENFLRDMGGAGAPPQAQHGIYCLKHGNYPGALSCPQCRGAAPQAQAGEAAP